jgi:hypothetical protein
LLQIVPTITEIIPSIKFEGTAVFAKRALVPTVNASTLLTVKFLVTPVPIVKLEVEVTPTCS